MIKIIIDHVGFIGLLLMLAADVAAVLLAPMVTPEGYAVELIIVSTAALIVIAAGRFLLNLVIKPQPAPKVPDDGKV